jgi:ParB family chromosome partitioning protein
VDQYSWRSTNKSERHKAALIEIAEDIRKGAGDRRIAQLVDKILLGDKFEDLTGDLIQSDSGQVFATWKNGAIIFSKNLNIDKKALNKYLIKFFTSKQH